MTEDTGERQADGAANGGGGPADATNGGGDGDPGVADRRTDADTAADGADTPADGDDGDGSPDGEATAAAHAEAADGTSDAVDETLRERVEAADPETLVREVAGLRERADEAEAALAAREERVEELESKLKRERADFQNYKKRMDERRAAERRRATEDLVGRLLDVRDNLARALDQDEDVDVRDGVASTLRQFDRAFEEEGVERVEPDPGDAVDPARHEVLTTVASDRPDGTVAELYRPGYEMGEKVLRPAQVTVSEADDADETDAGTGDSAADGGDGEGGSEADTGGRAMDEAADAEERGAEETADAGADEAGAADGEADEEA